MLRHQNSVTPLLPTPLAQLSNAAFTHRTACSSQAALKSAALIVERLLDREKINNGGKYPESIALVLWGTDNIKTYGEGRSAAAAVGYTCK